MLEDATVTLPALVGRRVVIEDTAGVSFHGRLTAFGAAAPADGGPYVEWAEPDRAARSPLARIRRVTSGSAERAEGQGAAARA